MKQFLIRGVMIFLLLAGTVGMAACAKARDELETDSQETVGATSDTVASVSDADTEISDDAYKIPNFTVLDWNGKEVKLSDFIGKPLVLNFWASWCPPCKNELPDFETACQKYDGDVVFLMVNMTDGDRETVETAKRYVESMGYTFPVYFDTKYEAAYGYGVSSIPQTYFIDADGTIVARATGMISLSQLEEGIGMIYSE